MIAEGRRPADRAVADAGRGPPDPATRMPGCKSRPPRYAGAMTPDKDDDADLFRAAIGPVRKLRDAAPPPSAPKPKPRARMAERDEAAARDEFRHALDATLLEAGDVVSYRRDSLPPRRMTALPALRQSTAASTVTLGRDS